MEKVDINHDNAYKSEEQMDHPSKTTILNQLIAIAIPGSIFGVLLRSQ